MTTTTARKPAASTKPAAPKPQEKKAAAPKGQKPAPAQAKTKQGPKPEPKTLMEALTTGQATLLKVRANGTKRSLPYIAVGTEARKLAEAVVAMRTSGHTVFSIAEKFQMSPATARRCLNNLALAQEVEAGQHDDGWKLGVREVIVHTVSATTLKA